jgi:oleandomycin transport system permease protein
MEHAILTEGLVKRFGTTTALDGVDLAVKTGTVLGLLGPNGAGKTTAVRVLATLLTPDGSTGAYLLFALPGIIVQNTIISTMNTGTGLNTDLTKGVFDRLRSLPIARWAPLSGRIAADMVKQTWAITLMFVVGAAMGFQVHNGVAGLLATYGVLLLFALAISWMSVFIGVIVKSPEQVQIFGFAVIFPLTFTSNAFAPTHTMPGWLQAWVKVNPVTILADAIRGLLQGGPVATPVGHTLLWALALTVVFAPLAVRAFKRKI